MSRVKPSRARSSIEETPEGFRVTIPVKRELFVIVSLGVWLAVFLFAGLMMTLQGVLNTPQTSWPPVFFLGGWMAGVVAVGLLWSWNVVGKEVADVNSTSLTIRWALFGFSASREFDLAEIRELRAREHPTPLWFRPWPAPGSIAFDYGARTYRFGQALDEAEAKWIVEAIKKKFPAVG